MLEVLKIRFDQNMHRHKDIEWETVAERLISDPKAMQALKAMEETGGEPGVIGSDGEYILFCDCSAESPAGRRSLCYDEAALRNRKKNPPIGSARAQAEEMGIGLMTEEQYRFLQTLGEFDLKTSSWIATPDAVRNLGGALFWERRYNTVFTCHNSADSYYGVRGWRGVLKV